MHNFLPLKASIETIQWLTKQSCAFRDDDESNISSNCGNIFEMIKLFGLIDKNIANVILNCAPKNAKYISAMIQKDIRNIIANNIQIKICQEVGNANFCILVEVVDECSKEKILIILRFVDCDRFIR